MDSILQQQYLKQTIIEETPNPYNPTIDSGQQVNIFSMHFYEKKPEQQEQPQTEKKIEKNNQKKKIKSHNKIKWKLYQWAWKSHQFIFQMKDTIINYLKVIYQIIEKKLNRIYFIWDKIGKIFVMFHYVL